MVCLSFAMHNRLGRAFDGDWNEALQRMASALKYNQDKFNSMLEKVISKYNNDQFRQLLKDTFSVK